MREEAAGRRKQQAGGSSASQLQEEATGREGDTLGSNPGLLGQAGPGHARGRWENAGQHPGFQQRNQGFRVRLVQGWHLCESSPLQGGIGSDLQVHFRPSQVSRRPSLTFLKKHLIEVEFTYQTSHSFKVYI